MDGLRIDGAWMKDGLIEDRYRMDGWMKKMDGRVDGGLMDEGWMDEDGWRDG